MNRESLHAFLDGELKGEERAAFERALAADPVLRAELAAMEEVGLALGSLPGADAPADFEARVRGRVRAGARGRLLRLALPVAAAVAAAAAALLLVANAPAARPAAPAEVFTAEDYRDYAWEADASTYGSLALRDLKQEILEELSG